MTVPGLQKTLDSNPQEVPMSEQAVPEDAKLSREQIELSMRDQRSRQENWGEIDVTVTIDGYLKLCSMALASLSPAAVSEEQAQENLSVAASGNLSTSPHTAGGPKLYVWTRDGMRETGAHEELSWVMRQTHEREIGALRRALKKHEPTMAEWEQWG